MFIKNRIIDKNKINKFLNERSLLTHELLKKEWDDMCEMSKELDDVSLSKDDYNFYEMYDNFFSSSLLCLSLAELEYIYDNNLFKFEENDILDYRSKKIIEKKISNAKAKLMNLMKNIEKENLGNYFQRFGDLFHMSVEGRQLSIILGLDNENIELTEEGKKLKKCIDNIEGLLISAISKKPNSDILKKR